MKRKRSATTPTTTTTIKTRPDRYNIKKHPFTRPDRYETYVESPPDSPGHPDDPTDNDQHGNDHPNPPSHQLTDDDINKLVNAKILSIMSIGTLGVAVLGALTKLTVKLIKVALQRNAKWVDSKLFEILRYCKLKFIDRTYGPDGMAVELVRDRLLTELTNQGYIPNGEMKLLFQEAFDGALAAYREDMYNETSNLPNPYEDHLNESYALTEEESGNGSAIMEEIDLFADEQEEESTGRQLSKLFWEIYNTPFTREDSELAGLSFVYNQQPYGWFENMVWRVQAYLTTNTEIMMDHLSTPESSSVHNFADHLGKHLLDGFAKYGETEIRPQKIDEALRFFRHFFPNEETVDFSRGFEALHELQNMMKQVEKFSKDPNERDKVLVDSLANAIDYSIDTARHVHHALTTGDFIPPEGDPSGNMFFMRGTGESSESVVVHDEVEGQLEFEDVSLVDEKQEAFQENVKSWWEQLVDYIVGDEEDALYQEMHVIADKEAEVVRAHGSIPLYDQKEKASSSAGSVHYQKFKENMAKANAEYARDKRIMKMPPARGELESRIVGKGKGEMLHWERGVGFHAVDTEVTFNEKLIHESAAQTRENFGVTISRGKEKKVSYQSPIKSPGQKEDDRGTVSEKTKGKEEEEEEHTTTGCRGPECDIHNAPEHEQTKIGSKEEMGRWLRENPDKASYIFGEGPRPTFNPNTDNPADFELMDSLREHIEFLTETYYEHPELFVPPGSSELGAGESAHGGSLLAGLSENEALHAAANEGLHTAGAGVETSFFKEIVAGGSSLIRTVLAFFAGVGSSANPAVGIAALAESFGDFAYAIYWGSLILNADIPALLVAPLISLVAALCSEAVAGVLIAVLEGAAVIGEIVMFLGGLAVLAYGAYEFGLGLANNVPKLLTWMKEQYNRIVYGEIPYKDRPLTSNDVLAIKMLEEWAANDPFGGSPWVYAQSSYGPYAAWFGQHGNKDSYTYYPNGKPRPMLTAWDYQNPKVKTKTKTFKDKSDSLDNSHYHGGGGGGGGFGFRGGAGRVTMQ